MQISQRVSHPKFGDGIVVDITRPDASLVQFDDGTRTTVLNNFLTPSTAPIVSVKAQLLVKDPIQEKFEKFHKQNPHVYGILVKLARQVRAKGRTGYGISPLYERARWEFEFGEESNGKSFKLSNNFRSRYARLIMAQEPDLAGFFDVRPLSVER